MDFRGAPGTSIICNFDVEKVLTPLIKENPEDGRLHVALADYYIEVYEKYRGRWLKSDEEILKNARVHYDEAAAIGDLEGSSLRDSLFSEVGERRPCGFQGNGPNPAKRQATRSD